MIATLRPCSSCNRHVRYSETRCPFCAAPQARRTPPLLPDLSRLSRAAQLAAGALFLAACASDPGVGPETAPPPVEDAGTQPPEYPAAMYGVPPAPEDPAPEPAPTSTQSPPTDPGPARPLYGMPPPR
jgi:hypothetical protein